MSKPRYKKKRLYSIMRLLLRPATKFYYRRFQVVGEENIPTDTPTFFAVNHQNAFMDAILVGVTTSGRVQPNYLTRSDVFNQKTLDFLSLWKMHPIYRQKDGGDYLKKNEEMFARFVKLLKMRDSLLIFPEGNHGRKRKLRPLRKGIGRIAFQAISEMDEEDKDVLIIPVGLNYSSHLNLRGDMLVVYGTPLHVKDYVELYQENDRKALIELKNDLAKAIQANMIHIKSPDYLETIEGLRTISSDELLKTYPSEKKTQYERLLAEKEMIAQVEEKLESGEINGEELKTEVEVYTKGLEELNIRDHVVKNQPYNKLGLFFTAIGLLLGLPAFLWGYLNHAAVYHFAINFTRSKFRDDHFHSSVMFMMAFFLYPLAYLIQGGVLWALTDWKWALGYLLTLPLFGNFALMFRRWVKKWRARWSFQSLLNKGDRRAKDLLSLRHTLQTKVSDWMKAEKVKLEK